MSQSFQQTEGVILRVTPFRDYDQIVTLFTPDAGIVKVITKGSRSKQRRGQGPCIPLTKVELIYREKRGEIFSCQEMTLVEPFLDLRKNLLHLEVACDLLQIILTSQLAGKASPLLYSLLSFYLEKIPRILDPWTLAVSFRLKLLKHDGLAAFPFICSECQQLLLISAYIQESEGWCTTHRPAGCQIWEQKELLQIYRLAICQSYREIHAEKVTYELLNKVAHFFGACVKK